MPSPALPQAKVDQEFKRLEGLLKFRWLPTEKGTYRQAEVDEFMLMMIDRNGVHFKHRDSRNYVIVKRYEGEDFLSVPNTGQNFMRGTFDVFDI